MKVKLIQIGNSMGIRLPQHIIKECGFHNEIDLHVKQGYVVLTPILTKRSGWKEIIQEDLLKQPIRLEGEWEW